MFQGGNIMAIKSEYAKLSMAVYSDADVAGWTKLIVDLPPTAQASGFFARAYQNNATNEVVIVYRGTEFPSDPGDLTADAALATDAEHQQFIDTLEFARQVYQKYDQQGYQISVTGHSLGTR